MFFSHISRISRFVIFIFLFAVFPISKTFGETNGYAVAAQYHCAGFAELTANTNLVTLQKFLVRRSTTAFQKVALARLSQAVLDSLHLRTNAALISPLLSDLFQTESAGAFGGSSNSLSFILALRSGDTRARLWQDILAKFPEAAFWTQRAQDWLLVGRGPDLMPLRDEYVQQIQAHGAPYPSTASTPLPWLTADLDSSRLASWLPVCSSLLKPARIHLDVAPQSDNFNTTAQITFAEPTAWRPTPWLLPNNLVRNPLVSFTAARNLSAFLNQGPLLTQFDANPLTNQFCAWALGQMPLLTYMAWPVGNINALKTLAPELTNTIGPELQHYNGTELLWLTNYNRLVWNKMRVVTPTLETLPQSNGPFLLLCFFPLFPSPSPAPESVWEELQGRSNLVYYDWEITGPRLQQWRLLWKMLSFRPIVAEKDDADVLEASWLAGFDSTIGKSVTEITWEKPNELALFRRSPLGLTGLEIVLLSDWISGGPAFASPPKNQ
jgi:hypothetical protein